MVSPTTPRGLACSCATGSDRRGRPMAVVMNRALGGLYLFQTSSHASFGSLRTSERAPACSQFGSHVDRHGLEVMGRTSGGSCVTATRTWDLVGPICAERVARSSGPNAHNRFSELARRTRSVQRIPSTAARPASLTGTRFEGRSTKLAGGVDGGISPCTAQTCCLLVSKS